MKVKIDRDADKPLYAQIRDAVLEAVESRALKPGDQLPPVAVFAKDLGVTQATIRRAYEDLTKSRHLCCQVGRGTFVGDPEESGPEESSFEPSAETHGYSPGEAQARQAARRLRRGIAQSLENLMAFTLRPGLINFTSGIPDPAIAREGILDDMVREALQAGQGLYQASGDPLGMWDLRRELAERFTREGAKVSPDQILITNGSQQALSLMAQAELEEGRRVLCETPCYLGAPGAFGSLGLFVEAVSRDHDGPTPERLARFRDGRPSLLYLCPDLHSPMGLDLGPERRRLVVQWAREQNSLLLADEIYRDLRFEGPPLASFLVDPGLDTAVVVGSLSKSFMGGLRVGWLIAGVDRIRTLAPLKRAMDLACPPLMQAAALALLRTGEYDLHLERGRRHNLARRDAVLTALKRHMPDGVAWTVPKGGFHMWVELPAGYSSIALFLMAVERGVSFIPGPNLDLDHRFVNAFRLSYGSVGVEQIREGIELLAFAVKELLKEPPGDPGLGGLGAFL
ncbi:MAG: PLP-dependent aminotransferase family protein [Pseudomonadota bacterium]